jgi:hypothetical protein
MMPTHIIARKVTRQKGKRASHHHFLGLAFRVWIGAILCPYVCPGIGNVGVVAMVSRRLRWVMRGFGSSRVTTPSSVEPSPLSLYCGLETCRGRL